MYYISQNSIGKCLFPEYVNEKESFFLSFLTTFNIFSYKSQSFSRAHVSIVPAEYKRKAEKIPKFSFAGLIQDTYGTPISFWGGGIKVRLSKLKIEIVTEKGVEETRVGLRIINECGSSDERYLCIVDAKGVAPISAPFTEMTVFTYVIKCMQLAESIFNSEYKCKDSELNSNDHNYLYFSS